MAINNSLIILKLIKYGHDSKGVVFVLGFNFIPLSVSLFHPLQSSAVVLKVTSNFTIIENCKFNNLLYF